MGLLYVALFLLFLAMAIIRWSRPGGKESVSKSIPMSLNILALVALPIWLMSLSSGSDSANAGGFVITLFVIMPLGFVLMTTLMVQVVLRMKGKQNK